MTDIEKAEYWFRHLYNGTPKSNLLFGKPKDYEKQMNFTAIKALQEKANREKACVDCKYLKTTTEKELPCRDCERRYEDFYKPKEATND